MDMWFYRTEEPHETPNPETFTFLTHSSILITQPVLMRFSWEPLSNYLSAIAIHLFLSPSTTPPHIHSLISSTASLLSESPWLSVRQKDLSLSLFPSGFHLWNDDSNVQIKQCLIKLYSEGNVWPALAPLFEWIQLNWKHFQGKVQSNMNVCHLELTLG